MIWSFVLYLSHRMIEPKLNCLPACASQLYRKPGRAVSHQTWPSTPSLVYGLCCVIRRKFGLLFCRAGSIFSSEKPILGRGRGSKKENAVKGWSKREFFPTFFTPYIVHMTLRGIKAPIFIMHSFLRRKSCLSTKEWQHP